MLTSAACGTPNGGEPPPTDELRDALAEHVWPDDDRPPVDVTNLFADDPEAAEFGHVLFFDARLSGPLLDDANNGIPGTLGKQGEAGRVSCAGCHVPDEGAFVDTRSPRKQLSLGAGWTHRKTASLLDVAQARFVRWDGRHDTLHANLMSVIESPLEMNSSRLFVAQQIARFHAERYEAIFGPLPDLSAYQELDAQDAGCAALPPQPVVGACLKPGHDDPEVIRVVVNVGKALAAYLRQLSCGPGRFDAWLAGDDEALTEQEQAGAAIFASDAGCQSCHSGPYFSDQRFHNIGLSGGVVPFTGVDTSDDPGLAGVYDALLSDPLSSRGSYSDGDDGRLDTLPAEPEQRLGAFRTPILRCVGRRPSYMHNAAFRSLGDAVRFFSVGGDDDGYVGSSQSWPRDFTDDERDQLEAFLRALDGSGPDQALREPP
ncbi:MAG: cytochrome c peroxidase [Polyangiaceae bacterium]